MKQIKPGIVFTFAVSILLLLSMAGRGAELGTRQQTVRPIAIPTKTPPILPHDIADYAVYGYSAWQWGPGEDEGRLFLTPAESTSAPNAARLLSFFSISDVHLTDKESPAQIPVFGWSAAFRAGPLFSACYSPIVLSTTQVLDAAVKTINALHGLTPFDFGLCLGDVANNTQYNELRWFIDVMDGQQITPSSGNNAGADTIGYQMAYQAAGLNRAIPWYQVIGNHDQFWAGSAYPTDKIRQTLVGSQVLNMSPNPLAVNASEGSGMYVGVIDGTTPYGNLIDGGPASLFLTPPTIAADPNRRCLTTAFSSTTNFMSEFFQTASLPVGHGFTPDKIAGNSACYTFEPVTNLPLKVIVLDDMAKTNLPNASPSYGASGSMDAARYAWLTNELQMGQDSNQLMILACHIPINPQADLFNTNSAPQFTYPALTSQTDAQLIATLHSYPNLILLMAGHRHGSTVTPQASPDPAHPEYGFWEVETPSLREFPQQFRIWEILRNGDKTISIKTTDVDPAVQPGSPAGNSRDYAIGAARVFGAVALDDTSPHTFNAELVKTLTPAMQNVIAGYGGPLGHRLTMQANGTGAVINFVGKLQSADSVLGPWSDVTNTSPYIVPAPKLAQFYRAAE